MEQLNKVIRSYERGARVMLWIGTLAVLCYIGGFTYLSSGRLIIGNEQIRSLDEMCLEKKTQLKSYPIQTQGERHLKEIALGYLDISIKQSQAAFVIINSIPLSFFLWSGIFFISFGFKTRIDLKRLKEAIKERTGAEIQ